MPSRTASWGIEVGSSAIKAIRLERSGEHVAVTDYDVLPFKKILTTPDLDVDEAIRVGLDQFLSRHDLASDTVVTSVAGHTAFAKFSKLPPVEPKKIPDIVRFEAVQQIPFPIDQVEWDYQTFQHPESPDVEVGIFAITKDKVLSWLSNFQAVGMRLRAINLSPVAVFNAMSYDMDLGDDAPGTIFMDIGTLATDLIIVERGKIWLRTIPIGGNQFTEALVRSFKLSYSKAEKLKREAATSKYARQIFQQMRPVFIDLVQEVLKSIGYYRSLNRDADLQRLIGLGQTFRLPGLQKFLKQQLEMDVSRLDEFQRIEVAGKEAAGFAEQALGLTPAYGLALQGVGLERVAANLLPTHVVRQEMWKSKQPWFAAAAAVMIIASAMAYTRLAMDRRAYEANQQQSRQTQAILNKARQYASMVSDIRREDPRPRIENLRRILDYRNVWPFILRDINHALASTNPQPALAEGNYDALREIPRDQRNQLMIETVEANYEFAGRAPSRYGMDVQGGMTDTTSSDRADDPWDMSEYYTTPSPDEQEPEVADETPPPSFIITVTGTTPRAQAPKFINDTFISWLKQKEREMRQMDRRQREGESRTGRDRPYQIRDVELLSIEELDESELETGRPERPPTGGAGRGVPGMGGEVPGMPPGVPGMGGGVPGMGGVERSQPSRGSRTDVTVDELLPSSPLAKEARDGDWRFVIKWRVQLIPPEAARKADADNARQAGTGQTRM